MAEHSEAKSAKRSFASKNIKTDIFCRFAQLFLAKFKRTTNWSLYAQGLSWATILQLNLKHGHIIHELSFLWKLLSRTKVHNIIWPCFRLSRKIVVRLKLSQSKSCSGNFAASFAAVNCQNHLVIFSRSVTDIDRENYLYYKHGSPSNL